MQLTVGEEMRGWFAGRLCRALQTTRKSFILSELRVTSGC